MKRMDSRMQFCFSFQPEIKKKESKCSVESAPLASLSSDGKEGQTVTVARIIFLSLNKTQMWIILSRLKSRDYNLSLLKLKKCNTSIAKFVTMYFVFFMCLRVNKF